jgi:RNA polymerase sigma-70 factor (ECF subfamily)
MPSSQELLANGTGMDPLRLAFEQRHTQLLAFVRWRSTPALGARRDPEDVLQAAFLRACKRRTDFAESGMAFFPWFCRVIHDCLCDDHDFHARRRRNYRAETCWPDRSSLQGVLGIYDPATSPSEALARKELQTRIEGVLARLTPEHQEIMSLIHFGELTKEQAASVLGIESNTARQRYARARARFREHWKACFGNEGLA